MGFHDEDSLIAPSIYLATTDLSAKGVEVVQANFDDRESVKKAFRGGYGVFAMTDCASDSPFPRTCCGLIV